MQNSPLQSPPRHQVPNPPPPPHPSLSNPLSNWAKESKNGIQSLPPMGPNPVNTVMTTPPHITQMIVILPHIYSIRKMFVVRSIQKRVLQKLLLLQLQQVVQVHPSSHVVKMDKKNVGIHMWIPLGIRFVPLTVPIHQTIPPMKFYVRAFYSSMRQIVVIISPRHVLKLQGLLLKCGTLTWMERRMVSSIVCLGVIIPTL